GVAGACHARAVAGAGRRGHADRAERAAVAQVAVVDPTVGVGEALAEPRLLAGAERGGAAVERAAGRVLGDDAVAAGERAVDRGRRLAAAVGAAVAVRATGGADVRVARALERGEAAEVAEVELDAGVARVGPALGVPL